MVCERLGAKSVEKILLTAAVLTVFTGYASAFAGGSGTQADPYEIANCVQLQEIQNGTTGSLSDHYELVSDIDCSATENWNNGNGFKPIGTDSTPFTGSVDGKGNRIQNFYINRQNLDYVGLFGFLDSATGLKNFTVLKSDVTGNRVAGGVIGYKSSGKASKLIFKGNVTGSNQVGGVVGSNFGGNITDSKASVNVSGDSFVGGLVGRNIANIISSKATGSINGVDDKIGGLTGYSLGEIRNSTSEATVSATRRVGGLVGKLDGGTVYRSHTESEVSADSGRAGVLVGENSGGTIDLSYSKGSVSANDYTGGLVGDNKGPISNSYARASVSGRDFVGGLVGRNKQSSVTSAYTVPDVTGSTDVAAVIGRNEGGTATDIYWDTESSTASAGIGSDDNGQTVTPLTTSEMQGLSASENMDFNWANDWRIQENDYPVPVQINGFSGGSGTQTDPYRIETCEQLQDMNQDLDAYYELVSDIECRGTQNWNNGKGFNPIGDSTDTFTGSFSGNNQSVYQLTISRGGSDYIAPFGFLGSAGEVREVKFEKLNVTGNTYVSGAVAFNEGDIAFVSTGGEVSGSGNRIGGIAGENNGASVTSSLSSADISGNNRVGGVTGNIRIGGTVSESFASGTVSGSRFVGGVSGVISGSGSTVSDSYSLADVTGNEDVGAIAGYNAVDLLTSFGAGKVSGTTNVGGAVGTDSGGTVTETYWDTVSTGQSSSDGGTPLTTSEMQGSSAETNMNLDFQSTWETVTGSGSLSSPGYPILRDLNRSRQIKAQGIVRFEGGSGTPEDPYEIATCQQLQDMNQDLTASYELVSDIDCSKTTELNGGKGFKPVGFSPSAGLSFNGSLDGKRHVVKNLYIDRKGEYHVALFGAVKSGTVKNIGLTNVNISGTRYTAGLVGELGSESRISRSFTSGSVDGGDFYSGGVVGFNEGEIIESFSSAFVKGEDTVGVIAGSNNAPLAAEGTASISKSYSTGFANATGGRSVTDAGGLVGSNVEPETISNSYSVAGASAPVQEGKVAGVNSGALSETYFDSSTFSTSAGIGEDRNSQDTTSLLTSQMQGSSAETNMAGLDFQNTWTSTFSYPKLSWQKSGSGTQDDPYQIYTCRDLQAMKNDKDAYYELAVDVDCSATTEWNGGNGFDPVGFGFSNRFKGSLSGRDREISDLFIERANRKNVGLFGHMSGNVSSVRLERADIIGDLQVGGIAGFIRGKIKKSFVGGKIVGFRNNVGGIAGRANRGEVKLSYSSAEVSSSDTQVGGLVGRVDPSAVVNKSYFIGNVSGSDSVGGIAGNSAGVINDVYSSGTVSADPSAFSVGAVAGQGEDGSDAYWDEVASGQQSGKGGDGSLTTKSLTTSEMQGSSAETNMLGLDFQDVWVTTDGYPELQTFQKSQDGGGGDEPPSDPGIPICDSRGPVFNTCISSTSHDVTGSSFSISAPLRVGSFSSLVSQGERADIQASGRVNISGTVEGDVNISGDDTVIRSGATLSPGEGKVRVR